MKHALGLAASLSFSLNAVAAPLVDPIFTFDSQGCSGTLAADSAGNIYGAQPSGGLNLGQIIKLMPPASPGGAWTESVLYTFDGSLGSNPVGGVTYLLDGSLIVTAQKGGPYGAGTVFRLVPTTSGPWLASLIHAFTGGVDGGSPQAAIIADAAGNLFGTAFAGGASAKGAVFALTPGVTGSYDETVLYSFTGGRDGAGPDQPLVAGPDGRLFGVTQSGGDSACITTSYRGCGTAFSVDPAPASSAGWTEKVIARYSSLTPLGAFPGPLTLHGRDDLVGASVGGPVYALVPAGPPPVTWGEKIIYVLPPIGSRSAAHGSGPVGNVVTTRSGNLVGSTNGGGTTGGYGGLYQITAPTTRGGGSETLFYSYPESSQSNPKTNVLLAPSGLLYQSAGNTMLQITPD